MTNIPQLQFTNKVLLTGLSVGDADVRWTAKGRPVVRLTILTRYGKATQCNRCVAFGELATTVSAVRKGSFVALAGHLQTTGWDDKHTGQKKYTVEVVISGIDILAEQAELPLTPDHGQGDAQ